MNAKTYTMTRTANIAAFKHGFSPVDLDECFANPKAVYPVKTEGREGQVRVVNRDVVLVGVWRTHDFLVITVFRNGSKVPAVA